MTRNRKLIALPDWTSRESVINFLEKVYKDERQQLFEEGEETEEYMLQQILYFFSDRLSPMIERNHENAYLAYPNICSKDSHTL